MKFTLKSEIMESVAYLFYKCKLITKEDYDNFLVNVILYANAKGGKQ
jgi:hypothetical protein